MPNLEPSDRLVTEPTQRPRKTLFRFVVVNKNFCNYPLARNRRTAAQWSWQRDREGWWHGRAPASEKLAVRFPPDTPSHLVRPPTALDMNVLFRLLAEAQRIDSRYIGFRSQHELLRALQLRSHQHRRRVREALQYWSLVTLVFEHWYFGVNKSRGEPANDSYELPPPIRDVVSHRAFGHTVAIILNSHWLKLHQGHYHRKLPLPLPADASSQNLALCVLVSYDPERNGISKPRDLRKLYRKLGLYHHERHQVLLHAIANVDRWLRRFGGKLEEIIRQGKIAFLWQEPKIEPPRDPHRPRIAILDEEQQQAARERIMARVERERQQRRARKHRRRQRRWQSEYDYYHLDRDRPVDPEHALRERYGRLESESYV